MYYTGTRQNSSTRCVEYLWTISIDCYCCKHNIEVSVDDEVTLNGPLHHTTKIFFVLSTMSKNNLDIVQYGATWWDLVNSVVTD